MVCWAENIAFSRSTNVKRQSDRRSTRDALSQITTHTTRSTLSLTQSGSLPPVIASRPRSWCGTLPVPLPTPSRPVRLYTHSLILSG